MKRLALLTITLALTSGLAWGKDEVLVPAQFRTMSDGGNFQWNVDTYGRMTINRMGSVNELRVAGSTFRSTSRMMTKDGREFVFRGKANRYDVTRRIRVNHKAAGVRYVDIIHNNGASPISVTLMLTSRINMSHVPIYSDNGSPVSTNLGARDSGVVATGNSNISALFWLADRSSKLRPTVYKRHNYELRMTWQVSVPARKSVAIVHGVGQVNTRGVAPGKSQAKLFKPFGRGAWVRDLPRDIRRMITNLRVVDVGGGESGMLTLEEELGLREQSLDVLAFGEETLVRGTASCKTLTIESVYGKSTVPFDKVAAIVGEANPSGQTRLHFRDGQKLSGKLSADGMKFMMTTGLSIDLSMQRLDRLVLRAAPSAEGLQPGGELLVETYTGDRLLVKAPRDAHITLASRWGVRKVGINRVRSLHLIGEGQPGYWVTLNDRSRFRAFLAGDSLALQSTLFGHVRFRPADVRSMIASDRVGREEEEEPDASDIQQPYLMLTGGDVLVGQVDLAAVHFASTGEIIPVPPMQVRLLQNQLDGDAPSIGKGVPFKAEIWGGGGVSGVLREFVLPIQTIDGRYLVPTRDILSVHVPTPQIPPGMRRRIAGLIRELGSPNWEKREAATQELRSLGSLARLPLEEARQQTKDPEIERRIRLLLERLEDE